MDDDVEIEALQEAIKHMHGCDSVFVEAVPVTEIFNGEVVWTGDVKVFDLVGHPAASRAYAWSHATTGERRRFVAVMHAGPVDSAESAGRRRSWPRRRSRRTSPTC